MKKLLFIVLVIAGISSLNAEIQRVSKTARTNYGTKHKQSVKASGVRPVQKVYSTKGTYAGKIKSSRPSHKTYKTVKY